MLLRRSPLVAALAALSCASVREARACATASPPSREVAIAQESALVVWDEKAKTEHFVRRAVFRSQAEHFGFLVPSPTPPTLAEEKDEVLDRLEQIVLPDIRYEDVWSGVDFMPLSLMGLSKSAPTAATSAAPRVQVLEQRRVGAFDAAVLRAEDAGALAKWLGDHGYDERPSLAAWLAPYVAQKWVVTAFKVADPDAATTDAGVDPELAAIATPRSFGGGTVRMSFHTERPFFPYREPADQREARTTSLSPSRALRIFFVGPARVTATIGSGATKFPGTTSWAGPLDAARAALPVAVPPGAWLTAFEDDASPRPGTDELWLDLAKDQSVVRPPPVVVRRPRSFPLPLDLLLGSGAIGLVVLRSRARRKRRDAARARSSS